MQKSIFWGYIRSKKGYVLFLTAFAAACIAYALVPLIYEAFGRIMDAVSYLAWHSIFEIVSILISFSVFLVTYNTYEQTKDLKSLMLGIVFLTIGCIDLFHTLSFKGMPDFLTDNATANRATVLWVIARLVGAVGLLATSFIRESNHLESESKSGPHTDLNLDLHPFIKKGRLLLASLIFSIGSLAVTTYFPGVLPVMYIEGTGLTPVKVWMEWIIIAVLAVTIIRYLRDYGKTGDHLKAVFASALLFGAFSELSFTNYFAVTDIYNYLGHVFKCVSYYFIFNVLFIDNVRKPHIRLSKAQQDLGAYIGNLDSIVELRTRELKKLNEKLYEDLEYARDVQKAMLPERLPSRDGICIAARYFPAQRLSGDFYNVFNIDADNIGILIGDVSGHGVAAAMLTVFINRAVNITCERYDGGSGLSSPDHTRSPDPAKTLAALYDSFNDTNFNDEVYIVLWYGILNTETMELTYASAGLNTMPMLADAEGAVSEILISGFPICKLKEIHRVRYANHRLNLLPGSRLLIYSDGLIEAENGRKEKFTADRLKKKVAEFRYLECEKFADAIASELLGFTANNDLVDDVTYLVIDMEDSRVMASETAAEGLKGV